MSAVEIIELIGIICLALGLIIAIVVDLIKGKLKAFIEEKMIEAEKSGKSGQEKLAFVIEEVKKKYKLAELFVNIKTIVEKIISMSKQINHK